MGKFIITLLMLLFFATHCDSEEDGFTFKKRHFDVVIEEDTHGGFHGDGDYYLVLDCSDNREKALENVKDWNKMPLPPNLSEVAYGATSTFSYFPDDAVIPEIENGYYYFHSRSDDTIDPNGDNEQFRMALLNFDFAIYDADSAMLYYLVWDS